MKILSLSLKMTLRKRKNFYQHDNKSCVIHIFASVKSKIVYSFSMYCLLTKRQTLQMMMITYWHVFQVIFLDLLCRSSITFNCVANSLSIFETDFAYFTLVVISNHFITLSRQSLCGCLYQNIFRIKLLLLLIPVTRW